MNGLEIAGLILGIVGAVPMVIYLFGYLIYLSSIEMYDMSGNLIKNKSIIQIYGNKEANFTVSIQNKSYINHISIKSITLFVGDNNISIRQVDPFGDQSEWASSIDPIKQRYGIKFIKGTILSKKHRGNKNQHLCGHTFHITHDQTNEITNPVYIEVEHSTYEFSVKPPFDMFPLRTYRTSKQVILKFVQLDEDNCS